MATIASLIVDVAANTAQLTTDVKRVNDSLDSMSGFAKKAGVALAGMVSIGAVKAAVGQFVDFAGSLTDLAAKTGLSTTELQKLKYAAEQNGGSLDKVTNGITKMGKALVEGKDSTVEAMKRLGLSINDVRTMAPGDAFTTIADKIATIPSPLERSKLAMDLFGKSGADLLPMMTGNLGETAEAAERLGIVLDEQTIAAGDNFGDTLSALQSVGMAILGRVLAPMLPALQAAAEAMLGAGRVVDWLRGMFDGLLAMVLRAVKGLIDAAVKVGEFAGKIPGLNKLLGDEAAALQAARDASVWLGGAIDGLGKTTDVVTIKTDKHRTAVGLMTEEDKKAIKVKKEKTQLTSEEIHAIDLLAAANKRLEASRKWEEEVGRKNLAQLGEFAATLPKAIFETRSFAGALDQVSESAARFQGNLAGAAQEVPSFLAQLLNPGKGTHPLLVEAHHLGRGAADAVAQGIVSGDWKSAAKDIGRQVSAFLGSAIAMGVNALVPGLGTMLEPIFGALISKIGGLFDRNKGRDIVTEFANSLGGFDALHKQLNALGDEGERLWIKLTQGVGRNNKDQARAAVEEVTAALEKHKTAQEAVQTAAVAANSAQIAAYDKAKEAVTTLDNQIKTLSDSIAGEAPEEFMGIVEQQTRARIAALSTEREAAQKSLEGLAVTMTDSIQDVAAAIRELPDKITLEFEYHGRPSGDSGGSDSGFATGTPNLDFQNFGRRRTVDVHGEEAIIPRSGVGQLASQIAAALANVMGGDTHVYIGNEQLESRMVRVAKNAAATGRLRPIAATGRGF